MSHELGWENLLALASGSDSLRASRLKAPREAEGFLGGIVVKDSPANAGDTRDLRLIPGLERSPRIGNGNPLLYSCLGNSMDRGVWQVTVHGFAKSWTRLNTLTHREAEVSTARDAHQAWCCSPETLVEGEVRKGLWVFAADSQILRAGSARHHPPQR